jgi:hypothetical protein
MLAPMPFVMARIGKVVVREDIVRAGPYLRVPAIDAVVCDLVPHAPQGLMADTAILRFFHA